jgi:glycolate oxidase
MKEASKLPRRLARLLPKNRVSFDPQVLKACSSDKWFAFHQPMAVAFPRSTDEVSRLLKFANQHNLPVTPRGAGFGYVGGCVPMRGGLVLCLSKMNRVREINPFDFVAVAEAGVVTAKLQEMVEAKNLFYPPDPASRADSFIGGNVATNAGGPRCLKYGVTRDYVLGMTAVLADGTVVKLGGRAHKNKTGFDFARFFTGSEGMLAVVTEITLKLLPLPPYRAALSAGFGSAHDTVRAFQAIFAAGFLPCALEVADAFTLAAAYKRTGAAELKGCRAHLIVELDGQPDSVKLELRSVEKIISRFRPRFVHRALGAGPCEALWQIRREFSYSLRDTGLTKLNQDVVVPRGRVEDLFRFAAKLQRRFKLPIACFGHAGDGNIHVNVMLDLKERGAQKRARVALDALFRQVLAWGGAITGEHGIGLAKKPWWKLAASREVRGLHQRVKNALDPKGILNPGKFL